MTLKEEARLAAYSGGNFAKNLLWATADVTLLYVLTDLIGLSPSWAGLIFLAGIFSDALFDLLIAAAADRTRTRFGQYGPYILIGAPVCAAAFVLVYGLPSWGVSDPALILICVLVFRIAYAAVDLPHTAMVGKVAADSRARGRVSGYRFFFSSAASLALALALPRVLTPGAQRNDDILALALGAAAISTATLWVAWLSVRRRDQPAPPSDGQSVWAQGRAALAAPSLPPLAAIAFITGLSFPLFSKGLVYFTTYVLDAPQAASSTLLALIVGQFFGVGLWTWLSNASEKADALSAAHAVAFLGFLAMAVLPIGAAGLIACAVVVGIGLSGVYMLIWGMAPDVVDHAELRTGIRAEATLVAIIIFVMKTGIGIGAAAMGLALQATNYVPGQVQDAETRILITFLTIGGPAAGALTCAVLARRHPISHARHSAILRRLARRRGSSGDPLEPDIVPNQSTPPESHS
ncbi:MFS transporter (plasmid) [Brevundimonas staleyi]|uniref:MFS transporter n=1 Tax=Brevundimonas staleyi TaxID=74326 RepID=A0ABW0FPX0_9CAUL